MTELALSKTAATMFRVVDGAIQSEIVDQDGLSCFGYVFTPTETVLEQPHLDICVERLEIPE